MDGSGKFHYVLSLKWQNIKFTCFWSSLVFLMTNCSFMFRSFSSLFNSFSLILMFSWFFWHLSIDLRLETNWSYKLWFEIKIKTEIEKNTLSLSNYRFKYFGESFMRNNCSTRLLLKWLKTSLTVSMYFLTSFWDFKILSNAI